MPVETRNNPYAEPPSPWVMRHAVKIPAGGRVLDLACGSGRHARWLAAQGFAVLAVDRDREALAGLGTVTGVEAARLDLEQGYWPLSGQTFAGIVVCRYLHRPLLADIAAALAPGGVLIYETFMVGQAQFGSPRRPEFLLESRELLGFAQAQALEVVDFVEGLVALPRPAMMQSICACRSP